VSATKTASRSKRGDELSPAELGAWRGFLRVHSALSRELDSELVAEHGLSLSSYEVLLFLAESPDGRMRMAELAESVLLSRSGLTRLADRLERDGLVTRTVTASVPPRVDYELTSLGQDLWTVIQPLKNWAEQNMATIQSYRERQFSA